MSSSEDMTAQPGRSPVDASLVGMKRPISFRSVKFSYNRRCECGRHRDASDHSCGSPLRHPHG